MIFSDAVSIMVVSFVMLCTVVVREGIARDVVGCLCRRGTLVTLHPLVAQINICLSILCRFIDREEASLTTHYEPFIYFLPNFNSIYSSKHTHIIITKLPQYNSLYLSS